MNPNEIAEKGRRAQSALDEFFGPAIETIRAEYLAALTQVAAKEPWQSDKIVKLAIASRVIDTVEAQLRTAIANGADAANQLNRARDIADLPAAKRRFLNY